MAIYELSHLTDKICDNGTHYVVKNLQKPKSQTHRPTTNLLIAVLHCQISIKKKIPTSNRHRDLF